MFPFIPLNKLLLFDINPTRPLLALLFSSMLAACANCNCWCRGSRRDEDTPPPMLAKPMPPRTPNGPDDDDAVVAVEERDCFVDEDVLAAIATISGEAWDEHDDEDEEAPSLS